MVLLLQNGSNEARASRVHPLIATPAAGAKPGRRLPKRAQKGGGVEVVCF
jgi:hypothetical protein